MSMPALVPQGGIGVDRVRARIARRGGSPREGVRSEARAQQRLAAGGAAPPTRNQCAPYFSAGGGQTPPPPPQYPPHFSRGGAAPPTAAGKAGPRSATSRGPA